MVTLNQSPESGGTQVLVIALVIGGLITIAVGVFLGATVSSALYLIALASGIDFALAWAYSSGRLGPTAQRQQEAKATGDVAAITESDPTYNPYARED